MCEINFDINLDINHINHINLEINHEINHEMNHEQLTCCCVAYGTPAGCRKLLERRERA
jgi:hypothetical protein